MNIRVKSMAIPLAFVALAAASATQSADIINETSVRAPQVIPDSVTVRYGDLDLNSQAGRDTLNARLSEAARTVCDHHGYSRSGSLSYHARARACYEESLAAAHAQVESGQLAARD